jgi:hypothetical protein
MAKDDRKKCTLKFQSRGDLSSALVAAEKWGIPIKRLGKDSEYLISIPADKIRAFKSLGSINFGIEVCN